MEERTKVKRMQWIPYTFCGGNVLCGNGELKINVLCGNGVLKINVLCGNGVLKINVWCGNGVLKISPKSATNDEFEAACYGSGSV